MLVCHACWRKWFLLWTLLAYIVSKAYLLWLDVAVLFQMNLKHILWGRYSCMLISSIHGYSWTFQRFIFDSYLLAQSWPSLVLKLLALIISALYLRRARSFKWAHLCVKVRVMITECIVLWMNAHRKRRWSIQCFRLVDFLLQQSLLFKRYRCRMLAFTFSVYYLMRVVTCFSFFQGLLLLLLTH